MNQKKETKPTLPAYQTPQIITFTDDQLLEELGPARAHTSGAYKTFELSSGGSIRGIY
jgi:hypothetical protein